jgi:hypothetical protein
MTTIRDTTFSVGKCLASPLTRLTDQGDGVASVAIHGGSGTHDRVFRFVPEFRSRARARRHAVADGLRRLRGDASH